MCMGTFINCIYWEHVKGHVRGLVGGHVWVPTAAVCMAAGSLPANFKQEIQCNVCVWGHS